MVLADSSVPTTSAPRCANARRTCSRSSRCTDDIHQLTVYVVGEQHVLHEAWVAVTACFNGDVPPATLLGVDHLGYVDQLVELDARVER